MNRTALRCVVNLGRSGTPGPPGNDPAGTAIEGARWAEHAGRRWGISSWCPHAPSGPALAELARAVRSCAG